jgi:hypothetical protein
MEGILLDTMFERSGPGRFTPGRLGVLTACSVEVLRLVGQRLSARFARARNASQGQRFARGREIGAHGAQAT